MFCLRIYLFSQHGFVAVEQKDVHCRIGVFRLKIEQNYSNCCELWRKNSIRTPFFSEKTLTSVKDPSLIILKPERWPRFRKKSCGCDLFCSPGAFLVVRFNYLPVFPTTISSVCPTVAKSSTTGPFGSTDSWNCFPHNDLSANVMDNDHFCFYSANI